MKFLRRKPQGDPADGTFVPGAPSCDMPETGAPITPPGVSNPEAPIFPGASGRNGADARQGPEKADMPDVAPHRYPLLLHPADPTRTPSRPGQTGPGQTGAARAAASTCFASQPAPADPVPGPDRTQPGTGGASDNVPVELPEEAGYALRGMPSRDPEPERPQPGAPFPEDADAIAVPPPAAGRAGRAKTRMLGFDQLAGTSPDPIARAAEAAAPPQGAAEARFPVGWLVVIDGPGRGAYFTLFAGVSQIGRGADQTVRLDFGDNSISRSGHALMAYDDEQDRFFLGSGGKVNIVRLNGRPLLSTEEIGHNDEIRIGETRLRFVAFCGPDFSWTSDGTSDRPDADGM